MLRTRRAFFDVLGGRFDYTETAAMFAARGHEAYVAELQAQNQGRAPRPPLPPGVTEISRSGHTAVVTTNAYTPELEAIYTRAGATVRDVRRLTLEEIFVATVMHNRKERGE